MLYTYVFALELSEEAKFDVEVLAPPIIASHVCRSWRRALLSDATMWTCIVFPDMNPEWIVELLRRSDSSLLNVFLSAEKRDEWNYDESESVLTAIFQHIHRFKFLRVQVNVWEQGPLPPPSDSELVLAQLAVSYLQRPAPKLQTLSFWYNYLDWYDYLDNVPDSTPDYAVIKKLFSGDAPRLKRMHHRLSRNLMELDCPLFHNLSEMRLTLLFNLNFSRFLDLLSTITWP